MRDTPGLTRRSHWYFHLGPLSQDPSCDDHCQVFFWSWCRVPCKSERVSPGEHRENVEKASPSEIFLILLTLLVLIYFDYWVIIVIIRNMFLQVFFLSITRVNLNDQQSIICAIQNLFHLSFTWVGHIGTSFFSYLHVGWNKKCLCSIFTSVHFFCILHAMW